MVRMKNSDGEVHDKSALCTESGCTPVDPEPPRMMRPPPGREYLFHKGVHKWTIGCEHDPKCTPVEEEKPMEFKITTEYRKGSLWCFTLQPPEGVGEAWDRGGYPSRESAKRAAEGRADTLAKESLKPETYTYQGKLT